MTMDPATILLFSALAMSPLNKEMPAEYVRNYDGDTITLNAEIIPGRVFKDVSYRVSNIDTAEIKAEKEYDCASERELALGARKFTADMLKQPGARIKLILDGSVDKYNRPLARISINDNDLGEMMIARGLARRWDGKRRPWCP